MILISSVLMGGCAEKKSSPRVADSTALMPAYTGPAFLHGTVGSMASLRGNLPQLASGYGIVVNLRGTGSADTPAYLRQWLINQMRKKGVGSAKHDTRWMTPEKVLASPNTAVVLVQGMIPPGATKGTRFDALVSALPQTQTTSLQGGQLWTVDLNQGGADPSLSYTQRVAQAHGPIFVDPLDPNATDTSIDAADAFQRQAVVLSGGVVKENRSLELVLHQPSWQRSRLIADRINERFPQSPDDPRATAIPINDSLIQLHLPSRYAQRPNDLLTRISHLYTQRGPGFEAHQAQRLADLLVADDRWQTDITLAWQAMGKTVLPVIRRYYDHPRPPVAMTALNAGTYLEDETASDQLLALAQHADPALRRQAARMLVHLPRSLRGASALHQLLDDSDQTVRVQAYESLAEINDPIIQRLPIREPDGQLKFVLDLVPSTRPLVYITQTHWPRLVIFNPTLALRDTVMARLWDNRLMMRASRPDELLAVFYQPPDQPQPIEHRVSPALSDLVTYLAHHPTVREPEDGLGLTYSQVAHVVNELSKQRALPSKVHIRMNPLARMVTEAQKHDLAGPRPETSQADLFDDTLSDPTDSPSPREER